MKCFTCSVVPSIAIVAVVLVCISFFSIPAAAGEKESLRIALLPILDTLPFHVAEEQGMFEEAGITVEAVPVSSAVERDQLMQSGHIDGMLNEMAGAANFNRDRILVKIVMNARLAAPRSPLFRILAAPDSGIQSIDDLQGASIGISRNTIIEYVTDRLLEKAGVDPDFVKKQSIPVIPERFQLLMSGQVDSAVIPDPLAASALSSGAVLIVDDGDFPFYSTSVISFHVDTLAMKPDTVGKFVSIWYRAAEMINQDPEAFRSVMLKKIRVPKNIQQTFRIPPYPVEQVPRREQWQDVMAWMVGKQLLEKPLPYADCVTDAFLRKESSE